MGNIEEFPGKRRVKKQAAGGRGGAIGRAGTGGGAQVPVEGAEPGGSSAALLGGTAAGVGANGGSRGSGRVVGAAAGQSWSWEL